MDDIGLTTWRMIRRAGTLSPAGLNLFWAILERDWWQRQDRGTFGYTNVYAIDLAEECHTTPYRINGQLDELKRLGAIRETDRDRVAGTRRIWVFHSERQAPDQKPDPQTRLNLDAGQPLEVDSQAAASLELSHGPGDGQAPSRGGQGEPALSRGLLRGDVPAQGPGGQGEPVLSRPEAGAGVHGSGQSDRCPPPSDQGGGGRPNPCDGAPQVERASNGARLKWSAVGPHRASNEARSALTAPQMERASNGARSEEVEEEVYIRAGAGAFSGSCKEPDINTSTSSTTALLARRTSTGARPKWSAPQVERASNEARFHDPLDPLDAIVARLSEADPEDLPWTEIRALGSDAARDLKPSDDKHLGAEARDLVLAASIVATTVERLGAPWIRRAARAATKATKSRRGLFFATLAEGLELAQLCCEGRGQPALRRLQFACGRAIQWFETRNPPRKEKGT